MATEDVVEEKVVETESTAPKDTEVTTESEPETEIVKKTVVRQPATGDVDIKKLLEAGAHFGHKTSRWHPKMAPFIHSKREGNHIIDLTKTVEHLEKALDFLEQTASEGKQILLVSTKRQAHDIIKSVAVETNMPYVSERWLGGMMTNRNTIGGRIKHLKDLETRMENGQLASKYSKLEVQRFQEEIDEMNHLYGGIKDMVAKVGAVFVVDILHDSNAVKEATKLGIPVVALVDTNTNPTLVKYPIPANDDAIKTIQLVADYVRQAILAGKSKHAKRAEKTTPAPDKNEKPAPKPIRQAQGEPAVKPAKDDKEEK